MKLENYSIEDLVYVLSKKIAEDVFETDVNMYNEEIEMFKKEGMSLGDYLKNSEGVEWYCNEQLPESVFEQASKHYKSLVNKG
jgi:hypothetical protein